MCVTHLLGSQADRQTDTHAYTHTDRLAHPLAEVTSIDKKTVTNTKQYMCVYKELEKNKPVIFLVQEAGVIYKLEH